MTDPISITSLAIGGLSLAVQVFEGIQKGMQRGVQQGEAAILTRLLQRRFGKLPTKYAQRIAQADAQTLLEWGEKILDAKTLDDVFNISE